MRLQPATCCRWWSVESLIIVVRKRHLQTSVLWPICHVETLCDFVTKERLFEVRFYPGSVYVRRREDNIKKILASNNFHRHHIHHSELRPFGFECKKNEQRNYSHTVASTTNENPKTNSMSAYCFVVFPLCSFLRVGHFFSFCSRTSATALVPCLSTPANPSRATEEHQEHDFITLVCCFTAHKIMIRRKFCI